MADNQPDFVPAYDTVTGLKVGDVPPHWLEPGSPFPNLAQTRSPAAAKWVDMPQDTPEAAFATPTPSPDAPAPENDAAADSGADTTPAHSEEE